jgi:pimeloyl-ACP methyl ester carboxylesterase
MKTGWDLPEKRAVASGGTVRRVRPPFKRPFSLSLETTRKLHIGSSPNAVDYDPDLWTDEFAFLSRPGETEIQTDLLYDYRTNEPSFPAWQAWMKQAQPPTLVIWGRYDPSFETAEAQTYKRELPNAEVHVIDAGHFALDEEADDIAVYIRNFFSQHALHQLARCRARRHRESPVRITLEVLDGYLAPHRLRR